MTAIITILCVFVFSACSDSGKLSVYMPDGAPAVALSQFMYNNDDLGTENGVDYFVLSGNEISSAITVKKADFVILPVNTATKLYNSTKEEYVMASVITHGNFYIVSSATLGGPSDLNGKIIYTPMRGKVPDWTLLSALKNNSLEYVEVTDDTPVSGKVAVRYFNEGADVLKALPVNGNDNIVGLLPEPAVTTIAKKKPVYSNRLDLQELYDGINKSYPQAVLMVKKSTADKYADALVNLAINLSESVEWAKNHVDLAVETVKKKFSATTLDETTMTKSAIINCNIYWQSSSSAKSSVLGYIENIRSIDAGSASVVGDGFFK